MVKVIMGLKGSGKTKHLVKQINEAVQSETGSVVCVEYGQKLTYDIDYRVRLIDAKEYTIDNATLLKGFISGLHAGNFDITHVFIESLYKFIGDDRAAGEEFVAWCDAFGEANDMRFTITVSDDPALASDQMKKYL
ncbi:MAG TPA: hypothetical protein IAB92_02725 [Candidatus Faecousia faecigallinarum]|nr:hypothetical protein [Candidatus Faecousia faecigallinarum]